MQLHQAMIYAKDLSSMANFYTTILGLTPIESTRTDSWLEYTEGLALHLIPPHIAEDIHISTPPAPREDSPIKLLFQSPDLPATLAHLESKNIPYTLRPWGTADLTDPEGNILSLLPPPQ